MAELQTYDTTQFTKSGSCFVAEASTIGFRFPSDMVLRNPRTGGTAVFSFKERIVRDGETVGWAFYNPKHALTAKVFNT